MSLKLAGGDSRRLTKSGATKDTRVESKTKHLLSGGILELGEESTTKVDMSSMTSQTRLTRDMIQVRIEIGVRTGIRVRREISRQEYE